MSTVAVNEMLGKMIALYEFAMVNAEVREFIKDADNEKALEERLKIFDFIPCRTKRDLGKESWEQLLAVFGCEKDSYDPFWELSPFIDYSAYGELCYNEIKEDHEWVYWGSTGVIYILD